MPVERAWAPRWAHAPAGSDRRLAPTSSWSASRSTSASSTSRVGAARSRSPSSSLNLTNANPIVRRRRSSARGCSRTGYRRPRRGGGRRPPQHLLDLGSHLGVLDSAGARVEDHLGLRAGEVGEVRAEQLEGALGVGVRKREVVPVVVAVDVALANSVSTNRTNQNTSTRQAVAHAEAREGDHDPSPRPGGSRQGVHAHRPQAIRRSLHLS